MKTVKELREHLAQFPDDMPVYISRHHMESGNNILPIYEPKVEMIYPSVKHCFDSFDGTHYKETIYSPVCFNEEDKEKGIKVLHFF